MSCSIRSAFIPKLGPLSKTPCLQSPSRHSRCWISTVTRQHISSSDVSTFRSLAFEAERPLHITPESSASPFHNLPAQKTWFQRTSDDDSPRYQLSEHVTKFTDEMFPFELVIPPSPTQSASSNIAAFQKWLTTNGDIQDQLLAGMLQSLIESNPASTSEPAFFQLTAPLRLLTRAVEFNATISESQPIQVYIAQSSISDLPEELQRDLPTPQLVKEAGKGDVYASSIWLGTEPTFTPLHRDPNPNLFHQLLSSKIIRLLPPTVGEMLFFEVQTQVRQQLSSSGALGSSRIRTAESMMQGLERKVLEEAVWGDGEGGEKIKEVMEEVRVEEGEEVFIPKGWWHSIRSVGDKGHLNGSVNWWFR